MSRPLYYRNSHSRQQSFDENRQKTIELSEAEREFEKWLDPPSGGLPEGIGGGKLGMDFVVEKPWTLLGVNKKGKTIYEIQFEDGSFNNILVDGDGKICGVEVSIAYTNVEYAMIIRRYL